MQYKYRVEFWYPGESGEEMSREEERQARELAALTKERDAAVARASRVGEMNPYAEVADDDLQEALREIEDLTVTNVRLETELATIRAQAEDATEYVLAQINAELRAELASRDARIAELEKRADDADACIESLERLHFAECEHSEANRNDSLGASRVIG